MAVSHFACDYNNNNQKDKIQEEESPKDFQVEGPWKTKKGHEFLTPQEEAMLISFDASKLGT